MRMNNYITTTDVHVAGEPIRVIHINALFNLKDTMEGYQQVLNRPTNQSNWKRLLEEPRGHSEMRLCFITPPVSENADVGILFKDIEKDIPLLTHGLVGVVTVLAETMGIIKDNYILDHLDGQCCVSVDFNDADEKVTEVRVQEEATFIQKDVVMEGSSLDLVAVNGNKMAILNASDVNVTLGIEDMNVLKAKSNKIFEQISEVELSHILFYEINSEGEHPILTIDRIGHIDRSPFSGTAGFIAYLYGEGDVSESNSYSPVKNFLGHIVDARILDVEKETIRIETKGVGYITGLHRFVIDATDPLKDGFLVK
ncbi:proline racemase family protein [Aquibacillus sp. 3ASR75-11]|uniref:Proline racemase family protein n=1 Tax=Terrihalobacillus insolitus TaxID=2950438 RepID=A0A9X4APD7_9BACI|nr:proline racemase family protein [Terrihalobacillus insolitus]MDC3425453.1 proline racemase family protein [Terrihalobacillus insolitus]